jgi:hypothetical protein
VPFRVFGLRRSADHVPTIGRSLLGLAPRSEYSPAVVASLLVQRSRSAVGFVPRLCGLPDGEPGRKDLSFRHILPSSYTSV